MARSGADRAGRALALGWLLAAASTASLAGCASTGPFVWYGDLPRQEWGGPPGEYVIGLGDAIRVQVYEQEALSAATRVRNDGRISLPFIGEVVAVGKHPQQLAREVELRLKEFIVSPRVVVHVDESRPIVVSVLGEVKTVGAITLTSSTGLLDALALAGGPSEFADDTKIFVIRRTPEFRRIRFTYEALVQNQGGAATFSLRTGDVIVIE